MRRERALKIVLVLVGLLFSAGIYPLTMSLWNMNKSDFTSCVNISNQGFKRLPLRCPVLILY